MHPVCMNENEGKDWFTHVTYPLLLINPNGGNTIAQNIYVH